MLLTGLPKCSTYRIGLRGAGRRVSEEFSASQESVHGGEAVYGGPTRICSPGLGPPYVVSPRRVMESEVRVWKLWNAERRSADVRGRDRLRASIVLTNGRDNYFKLSSHFSTLDITPLPFYHPYGVRTAPASLPRGQDAAESPLTNTYYIITHGRPEVPASSKNGVYWD